MSAPEPSVQVVTHRDTLLKLAPWWLRGYRMIRILFAIGILIDAVAEQLLQGLRRRFPGYEDASDALGVIGRDRRIRRGPNEPDATYALRLQRWLDDHPRRGNAYALLRQFFAYYRTSPYAADLVYLNGTGYSLDTAGNITSNDQPTFNPDAIPKRGRWWLFVYWPEVPPGDGIWSDPGTWDDGGVWDSGLTVQQVTDLRLIPREWGNGHSIGSVVLLAPGSVPTDYTTGGPMIRLEV